MRYYISVVALFVDFSVLSSSCEMLPGLLHRSRRFSGRPRVERANELWSVVCCIVNRKLQGGSVSVQ